ncbi:DUF1852 domain-containing protein [Salinicola halophilus]|uniref:DUF1852 domain-containing protein n=1 Tax=Salinicola halophilus TaxID=184065 RepID=UPI000DA2538D|nr:DUF1852 domain-containing protein [Salinicola halophilus]
MSQDFTFTVRSVAFDEDYRPAEDTRTTTNFANLARGERRRENLRNALTMIDNRFNSLAQWDNPNGDRYALELEIVTGEVQVGAEERQHRFPAIEVLKTTIVDQQAGKRLAGMVGNNFSSYVRDYDFSVRLAEHNRDRAEFGLPEGFGDLHGQLFRRFIDSEAYRGIAGKPPVICLSVSSSKQYRRTDNHHPVLGVEYQNDDASLTDFYFGKMGLEVRYFMPPNGVAPLAFYFAGDLLTDYTTLELISAVSTMESFQKIYRPEIYNANSPAGPCYRPSLEHADYSLTRVVYDREERSRLGVEQGKFAEEHFIKPYRHVFERWSANGAVDQSRNKVAFS